MKNYEAILENKQFADFNPLTFGYSSCFPNHVLDISERHYCLIHYIISGKGTLKIYGKTHEVSKNQIFIIPKNVANYYQADGKDPWSYMWIGFTGNLAKQFTQLPPVMDFHSNIFFNMATVMELTSMREEFLAGKLFDLYRFLFSDETTANYASAIQNFIDTNYMSPEISIEKIAHTLNLNRSYLTRCFKQEMNMSIQEYLISTRVSFAISLLKKGASVQETARQVGYLDPFNFSKMFKRKTGFSPSDFRIIHKTDE